MAIRNILNDEDETLRKKSRPVESFDRRLHMLLDDMIDTLNDVSGVGLAAVQVGVLRRAVIIDDGEKIIELINPDIVEKSGRQEDVEGCLSCPGKYGITKRPMNVTVRAQDRFGKQFEVSGEGLLARAFCHECDHLDGKLFYDHVIRMLDPDEIIRDDD